MSDRADEIRAELVEVALDLVDPFDALVDAARRFASLTSQVSEAELAELAQFADDLRCHYDQKAKVHYIGLWKKTDVAPRVVLTALRVLRSVEEGET